MGFGVKSGSVVFEVILSTALAVSGVLPAFASETHQFDVPAEDAPSAIRDFASQAHVQILVAGENVKDKHLHAVTGEFSTDQGLRLLLADSGLSPKYVGDRSIAIVSVSDSNSSPGTSRDEHESNDKGGKKNFWDTFRLAQSNQGTSQSASTVGSDAQSSSANYDNSPPLEQIIVTAQRREERLIDVPINITAITAAEIGDRNVTNLKDMQYAVPGLTIASTGVGSANLQLNGVAEGNGGSFGLPVVGVYIDEMPLNAYYNDSQPSIQLLDMERVEVLHGPQPALYGDGAMGGTIRYVTASPDLGRFSGHVEGWWGDVTNGSNSYRGTAVLNAPVVDGVLGIRLAASYERDGGWVDSLLTGAHNVNDHELADVRAKILFRPSDALSISLLYQHDNAQQPYQDFSLLNQTTALTPTPAKRTLDLANLIVTGDVGIGTLLSSTGFVHSVSASSVDFTAYFRPYLPVFYPQEFSAIQAVNAPSDADSHVFSEEVRLSSKGSEKLHYLLGANYRHYEIDSSAAYTTTPSFQPVLFDESSRGIDRTWAIFGEVGYAIAARFDAILSLRHFEDHQSGSETQLGDFAPPPATVVQSIAVPSGTFVSNNPEAKLSFRPFDDGLLYASAAKGFRSGGTNAPPNFGHPTYGPETLWTYTIGAKQEWLNHRLSLDLAGYYNQWKNVQDIGLVSGSPTGYYSNAGRASGPGADLSLRAAATRELSFAATVGYADMHYDQATAATHEGDPVNLVQKWTYSFSADYQHALVGQVRLVARTDYQYTSGYSLIERSLAPGIWSTPSRGVLNVRLGADIGQHWQVYLVGSNLTNNISSIYPAIGAFSEPCLASPRTVGLGAKVGF